MHSEKEKLAKEYCEIVERKTGEKISVERALQEMKQFSMLLNFLHKEECKKLLRLNK